MTRPPVRRLVVLLVVMLFAFGGIVVRLASLQVRGNRELAQMGLDQRVRTIELPADRGKILDRNRMPLAITLEARDVYANPRYVTDAHDEAATIAPILGLKEREVRAQLATEGTFVFLDRRVDLDVAERLAALHLPGIGFLPVPKRYYPAGALAPQVLGFVGDDGYGLAGLEAQYEEDLAGTPGERTTELSADGLPISSGVDAHREAVPGRSLVLTLDRQIQFMAQAALARVVQQNHAKGGTVVVMDPRSGDIYAMATHPWFDPNAFEDSDPEHRRNRAVTDMFEPGSVNKIITAAAAIETRAVALDEPFRVPARMTVGPFTISDSHRHPVETMTIGDIIARSSNIGSAMVAERVGSAPLAAYMERFGYGETTGLAFPGEASGIVPAAWDEVVRATASYGQGVAVTPLQMAGVYATIANGGTWVEPRLVRGSEDAEGRFLPAEPSTHRRVVRPPTADLLTRMLAYVVQDGTGYEAQIPGYQVAGKTGTARKLDRYGHYIQRYMASFVGFLPASRPELVIAVTIDEPTTVYGGIAAAPLFQEIARYAVQRLGIPAAPPVAFPPQAQTLP